VRNITYLFQSGAAPVSWLTPRAGGSAAAFHFAAAAPPAAIFRYLFFRYFAGTSPASTSAVMHVCDRPFLLLSKQRRSSVVSGAYCAQKF
jgi:hypothetical protein